MLIVLFQPQRDFVTHTPTFPIFGNKAVERAWVNVDIKRCLRSIQINNDRKLISQFTSGKRISHKQRESGR